MIIHELKKGIVIKQVHKKIRWSKYLLHAALLGSRSRVRKKISWRILFLFNFLSFVVDDRTHVFTLVAYLYFYDHTYFYFQ